MCIRDRDDGLAQIGRQLLQRGLQNLASLAAGHGLVRTRRTRGASIRDDGELIVERIRHPVLTRPPVMIDQKIAREARQPGAERAFRRAKRVQRAEDAQEDFLRQIL